MKENNNSEEVSLKELGTLIKSQIEFIKARWKIISLITLLGGVLGASYALLIARPVYTSNLTFVLSNDSKSGGLGALAGNFGIELGSNSEGAFAGENIVQLLLSKKMVERSLTKQIPNSNKTILDEIVTEKFLKKWESKRNLSNVLPLPRNISNFTPLQDSLLTVVTDYILKKYLTVTRVDKKLSFYRVVVTTPRESVSRFLPVYLVDEASKFYIETKTKQARKNLAMLQNEADSLRFVLGGNVSSVANQSDQLFNLNPSIQRQRIPQQNSQIQVQVLGTAYGEVIKNLEIAKITLQKETPLYQLIDTPGKKLRRITPNPIITTIAGLILFLILSVFYFTLKRFFK